MEIKYYDKLPIEAVEIRNEVFVDEQGFSEEFDTADQTAIHIVGFINGKGVATARVILVDDKYFIGRIAVRKAFRGRGYGLWVVKAAEEAIRQKGASLIHIHSQTRAVGFYQKLGYCLAGVSDVEEGCPHELMVKTI